MQPKYKTRQFYFNPARHLSPQEHKNIKNRKDENSVNSIAKQEMLIDTYAPLTLNFDKINRGHLLVMTNLHVKYEDCDKWYLR